VGRIQARLAQGKSMNLITEPGIYDVDEAVYNAEPCAEPSLRSSIAWKLIAKGSTPAHARLHVPAFNPNFIAEHKRSFDIGRACHKYLLGKGALIADIAADNYKTKAAQEARDAAYTAGKIPLLPHEHQQVKAMATAAREQLRALVDAGTLEAMPFSDGQTERVIVWRKNGVLCRAMLDGLPNEYEAIDEYKSDGESADPQNWQWKARRFGYFFRQAFYRDGLEQLRLAYSPHFRFFVQETAPPYLLAFIRVEDEVIMRESQNVRRAINIWKRCVDTGVWPGYSLQGYDLGLTEREQAEIDAQHASEQSPRGGHVDSESIAATVNKPSNLFRKW